MDQIAQPLNIELLRPFPLPRTLEALPAHILQELSSHYELVKGYTKLLQTYQDLETQLRSTVQTQISTLNKIIVLLDDYNENSAAISANIKKMELLYKEFMNYETYQYQLMSSNFNQNVLKLKYSKLVSASDAASLEVIKSHQNSDNFSSLLQQFRQSRKEYHLLKEKLNRWDEERISGLI